MIKLTGPVRTRLAADGSSSDVVNTGGPSAVGRWLPGQSGDAIETRSSYG